ncbi:MAG: SAM-dependent methyltransferase [Gammaproteobacteria bacterium]|nr:MAG: SAM-dependent methyltransferase [Gammaproteobacteria bacterium]
MSFYEDKIFPYALDIALAGVKQTRIDVISQAQGRVLEIGIGNGANLPFYSKKATEVVGIEPCSAMVDMAAERLEKLASQGELALEMDQYNLQVGSGEALPYENDSFDTAVACLVFCTIPNTEIAAQEMYRVLKPGGKVLFFEHVQASGGMKRTLQKLFNPIWKPLACGCHLNRDTKSLFKDAGFRIDSIEEVDHPKMFPLFSSVILGEAVKV